MRRSLLFLVLPALAAALVGGSTAATANGHARATSRLATTADDHEADGQEPACETSGGAGSDDATESQLPSGDEGTSGDDHMDGGDQADEMQGDQGDDVIDGQQGDDDMCGDQGDDDMNGGPGNDNMAGGPGNDRLNGGSGNDDLEGDAGDDTEFGDAGNDTLRGDSGNDVLVGGRGRDHLSGGRGNDVIRARDGRRDVIRCGAGHDRVIADHKDKVADDCESVSR